ncbi:hypothetical protein M752DRAFT_85648 [Aspergillus phoenicis ATCC 13157]|uniref:Uncharacterized protein n=1 Tax=Aspergillus niger ATCC 13496 TaxID=1353008 RepID=A0A370BJG3_ASPNG|nr:hypothetical protein M747DRAFT_169484 [Aspergillus niger ATCC 13496]RDK38053.1 hypothetical protein M752DRAFT_85648 [Aspergillus phoenicis ATCC 13157]
MPWRSKVALKLWSGSALRYRQTPRRPFSIWSLGGLLWVAGFPTRRPAGGSSLVFGTIHCQLQPLVMVGDAHATTDHGTAQSFRNGSCI